MVTHGYTNESASHIPHQCFRGLNFWLFHECFQNFLIVSITFSMLGEEKALFFKSIFGPKHKKDSQKGPHTR